MKTITIYKRTRTEVTPATDPVTYNPWSDWTITTDVPPYNNTLLVEYKLENDVSFKDTYLNNYSLLMSEALKSETPYDKAVTYMNEQLENLSISPKEEALLKAQFMANITNSITINAMQMAMSLTDKNHKFNYELVLQKAQADVAEATMQDKIDISKYQKETSEQNYIYAKEKAVALPASIVFNNWTKSLSYFSEAYGQHKIGGGTITESMWKPPLEIAKALMLSDVNYNFTFEENIQTST